MNRDQPRIAREQLRETLQTVLSRHFGAVCVIKTLRRRRSVYSSSAAIENLDVELATGQRLNLVLKDLSPAAQLAGVQKVRPIFLYTPMREIETYQSILQAERLDTARCYGALVEPEQERYWLFLERVRGPMLWQRGRLQTWAQAARWLARLHTCFCPDGKSRRQERCGALLSYDASFFRVWLGRAEKFLEFGDEDHPEALLRRFRCLAGCYDVVIGRLLELPTTFIHGEFYPSNILLRAASDGRRICPIDWEVAAVGPGVMDLAALTAGDWEEEDKRKVVAAYGEAMASANSGAPSLTELLESVALCQLHLAVQMLGWAADWRPPAHQAQNWLDTACRLADKLGI